MIMSIQKAEVKVNSKHLLLVPTEKAKFFSRESMRETLRLEGNKIKCFPRNQSLSDLLGERTLLG